MVGRSLWTACALVLSVAPASCSDSQHQGAADASPAPADAAPDAAPVDAAADAAPVDAAPDASTPLSLLAAGATKAPVTAAVPGFATQNGLTINITFGSAGALRDQILTGTSGADVAIVTPAVINVLSAQDAGSLVYPGSRVDLAQVAGGIAVRSGDALPDISDSDKFKAALLAADEIYYADPSLATAGAAFISICKTLGIGDTCAAVPNGKGHTAPEGADAMAAMALSTATTVIGSAQLSEIIPTSGVQLVGEYPAAPIDLHVNTIYSAIIVEGTRNVAGAQLLLQYLGSDSFMTQLAAYGFVPIPDP
jgi:molybdate transport system substrate-binding protein